MQTISPLALISISVLIGGAFLAAWSYARTTPNAPAPSEATPATPMTPVSATMNTQLKATGYTPAPEVKLQTAMFGAGCFWGVEAKFRETKGVVATGVGYAGGKVDNPTYKEVCADTTGHAEVVQVQFDPGMISYEELLDIFWTSHNPTTLNRQGPDFGSQYRSVVFYYDDAQKQAAEKTKQLLAASGVWGQKPIVTFIEPAPKFYIAEEYHQQYLEKRGLSTCHTP